MKQHTNDFKTTIKSMGRQIKSTITYGQTTLQDELFSVSMHYEGNLLKSIMKQLDIECDVEIPLGTTLNYKLGVLVGNSYEELDYGNYVVYSVEKQEDTDKYKIICYDKMLYSMVDYASMNNVYPITIRNYLQTICNTLGLTFKNANETFVNYNKEIAAELYLDSDGNSLGYTFRDVLDEIAEATASNIIINSNDELEIKYFITTNETINEEMLKDINVKFGQSYEMNTIVLSRAGGADKIYKSYPENLPDEDKKAIEIQDNQIMNWNDRDTYMEGILNQLRTLTFYINDFNSTGICYLDPCDIYNIQIGETSYPCVMLNDEINITTGLEEIIHTDMPEGSETDYTKADKTDRRINQTTLIVDKQNQEIQGIITQIGDRSQKTTSITQDIDRIESNVQDIEDVTEQKDSNLATLTFEDINRSEPIRIIIRPINSNISYLYPRENLYPSDTLYLRDRIIRFTNTTTNETIDYEIPADLLYYDSNNYDEFILDYSTQTCKVTKKCGYNADGTVYVLATPQELTFDYPTIDLADGDYTITINGYNIGYLLVKLMKKNDFTEQFTTTVEMNSSITQTAEDINLEVRKKVGEDEIISKINQTAEDITIDANRININGTVSANGNFKVDTNGNMEAVNGKFTGGKIELLDNGGEENANLTINSNDYEAYYMSNGIEFYGDGRVSIDTGAGLTGGSIYVSDGEYPTNNYTRIQNGSVDCLTITQRSLENAKKNFKKLDNAMNIIKNVEIYKYNLKTENDNDKQHIGFVIGDNFKYSNEITSKNNDGVDIYSFVSVCCKAIQEQQEYIDKLEKRIEKLEGGN